MDVCSVFTPRELDEMRSGIKAVLDDPLERKRILEFTGTEEVSSHAVWLTQRTSGFFRNRT